MTRDSFTVGIILAAGKGTRMKSDLPKVLHKVGDKPMLYHVLHALEDAGIVKKIAVLSEAICDQVADYLQKSQLYDTTGIALQLEQKGTADAVASTWGMFTAVEKPPYYAGKDVHTLDISGADYALICTGDAPAIDSEEIKAFIDFAKTTGTDIAVVGMDVPNPTGYGRLVTDAGGSLIKIVEEKDADAETKKITLCNSGVICAKVPVLFDLLSRVTNNNSQGEYYLTDCFDLAVKSDLSVKVFQSKNWECFLGINTPEQLKHIESIMSGV